MKKIVVIGATSGIAQAICRQYAEQKNELFLIARNRDHLESLSKDIAIRSGRPCGFALFDAKENQKIEHCLESALAMLSEIDVLVIAHGTLPSQEKCRDNLSEALLEFQINATSYIGLMTLFGNYFRKEKKGSMVVFSSCAGDRGRKSNYLYGATKAAISTFSSGLRASLHSDGVHVMTVKPGFVDTPMTADFKKNFLWASPDKVASAVIKAVECKKSVLYVPRFWSYIMLIIKHLPEFLMRKVA